MAREQLNLAVQIPPSATLGFSSDIGSAKSSRTTPLPDSLSMPCTPISPSSWKAPTALAPSAVLATDILALGDLLAAMKQTLNSISQTSAALGAQIEKVAYLGTCVKASEQVDQLDRAWAEQINAQKRDIAHVRSSLQEKIIYAVEGNIRDRVMAKAESIIAEQVEQRVREQLNAKIPDKLRQRIRQHKRQILEIQTNLHNSDARRFNANLNSASNEPLRPLLRPVPTPQQSPASARMQISAPGSAYPASLLIIPEYEEVIFSPSPSFPRTVKEALSLSPDDAEKLARAYGLVEDGLRTPLLSRESHLNKLMAHIGVRPIPAQCRPQLRLHIPGHPLVIVSDCS